MFGKKTMPMAELKSKINNDEIASTIISLVLNVPKSNTFTLTEVPITDAKRIIEIAEGYKRGIPIAYQTNKWYFYDLPFYVNRDVLIPRFDTEILVSEVIKRSQKARSVLDLCTGSGCIAIALAKNLLAAVTASDISEAALTVARKNAATNDTPITFILSDLFANIHGTFDVITCNPPYIKTDDIGKFDPSTLHEPKLALDGGVFGTSIYARLIPEAQKFLNPGGLLALEIGHDQAADVTTILTNSGFNNIQVIKDLNNLDRVVLASKS
jgi:release factor glutamine methyltransferase